MEGWKGLAVIKTVSYEIVVKIIISKGIYCVSLVLRVKGRLDLVEL